MATQEKKYEITQDREQKTISVTSTALLPSHLTQVDTPSDHNCLFWSAALALLLPRLGESEADKQAFSTLYTRLFGSGSVELQNGQKLDISAVATQEGVRHALKSYNFSKNDPLNFAGNLLYVLIAEKFRRRAV